MNVDIPILQKEQLYIDQKNNKTIWVENVSTQIENYEERKNDFEAFSSNQVFASLDRTIPNDYIIIDYNRREINIVEDLGRKVFLVKDNFVEKKWILQNETKIIDNILCYKAKTSFRGNNWEVWYAPSIPYPYGPWKLNGLPGLILEAKSSDDFYAFVVEKIEYNYEEEEAYVPMDKILKEISFRDYLEYQDYLFNLLFLGRSIEGSSNIFLGRKEKEFEIEADLSWEKDNRRKG